MLFFWVTTGSNSQLAQPAHHPAVDSCRACTVHSYSGVKKVWRKGMPSRFHRLMTCIPPLSFFAVGLYPHPLYSFPTSSLAEISTVHPRCEHCRGYSLQSAFFHSEDPPGGGGWWFGGSGVSPGKKSHFAKNALTPTNSIFQTINITPTLPKFNPNPAQSQHQTCSGASQTRKKICSGILESGGWSANLFGAALGLLMNARSEGTPI